MYDKIALQCMLCDQIKDYKFFVKKNVTLNLCLQYNHRMAKFTTVPRILLLIDMEFVRGKGIQREK